MSAATQPPAPQIAEFDPFGLMPNIRGAVARGWCADGNRGKEMDSELAEACSREVLAFAEPLVRAPADIFELRGNTERTHEDAYHAMFKSSGRETWEAAYEALEAARTGASA